MPNKLKNLKITSTDLVEQGANPDAHIRLFKGIKKLSNIFKTSKKEANSFSDVKKDAQTFEETFSSELLTDVVNEIYDFCYALADSFSSIINDKELDSSKKSEMLSTSLNDFSSAVLEALPSWGNGEKSGAVVEKSANYEYTKPRHKDINQITKNEEGIDMKIDKTKMTFEELSILSDFEKRYGTSDEIAKDINLQSENDKLHPDVKKALSDFEKAQKEHIAEIEELKKSLEIEKLTSFAKKYEVIGKKACELAPKLYILKKSGSTAYSDYISLLDEQIALAQKSGAFSELGSGHAGSFDVGTEFAKKATEIAKQANITIAQAFTKVYEQCPELAAKYEIEYGGDKNNA